MVENSQMTFQEQVHRARVWYFAVERKFPRKIHEWRNALDSARDMNQHCLLIFGEYGRWRGPARHSFVNVKVDGHRLRRCRRCYYVW
jgi:hypothetical protein